MRRAVMGSLRKEFRQSALEVLNIVDAEQSKNCGRRPTEEVQTKCPAADSIIFNTYKKTHANSCVISYTWHASPGVCYN